jgi:hypothetical protein
MPLTLSGSAGGRLWTTTGPPWVSVPPSSEAGFMGWNINGVRFCVRYTTWPTGWNQALSGHTHTHETQRMDAPAPCTHTGAPVANSRWQQSYPIEEDWMGPGPTDLSLSLQLHSGNRWLIHLQEKVYDRVMRLMWLQLPDISHILCYKSYIFRYRSDI